MMRRRTRAFFAGATVLVAGLATACSFLTSFDDLSGGATPGDAGRDTTTLPLDAAGDADADAASPLDAADAGDAAPSASALYASAVLLDKPLGYWRLEETGGTKAKDETGRNDGTFINSPQLGQPGIAGGLAAKLPASLKARMAVTTGDFGFLGNAPYTIELWAKPGSFRSYLWLVDTEIEVGGRHGWSLLADGAGILRYEVWASDGDGGDTQVRGTFVSVNPVTQGVFAHVVVTYTGSVVLGYVNGVQTMMYSTTGKVPVAGSLLWGCRGDLEGCLDDWVIDELALYDYALDGARAKAHFDLGK